MDDVKEFCDVFFKDHYIKDPVTEIPKKLDPYTHQIETAFSILKNRYAVGEVATSGGKTLILSIIYFYILTKINADAKILLIVPTISLVTQTYDEIMNYNYGFNKENKNPVDIRIQEIMSDKPRQYKGEKEPNIIISTYQSLAKTENFGEDFYKQFFCVTVDEGHLSKSDSFKKILRRTIKHAYYQFGVSGTFYKEDTAEWLMIANYTGPKTMQIKVKELQEKGIVSELKVKCIYLNHNDPEFEKKLLYIRRDPNKGADAYRLEGDYIRESKLRKEFITKLVFKCKKNTLVLFNIIEYGTSILEETKKTYDESGDKYEFYYIDGQVSKDNREAIKKEIEKNDGIIRILFASYGTLSTGISIKNLHNIILAEGFKAEHRIIQSIGRSLRLHETKSKAYIFDLIDVFKEEGSRNVFYRHGEKRKEIYKEHQYPFDIMKINLV